MSSKKLSVIFDHRFSFAEKITDVKWQFWVNFVRIGPGFPARVSADFLAILTEDDFWVGQIIVMVLTKDGIPIWIQKKILTKLFCPKIRNFDAFLG